MQYSRAAHYFSRSLLVWQPALAFLIATASLADSVRFAVLASATVQESPPQITFTWPLDDGTPGFPVLGYNVYRKAKTAFSWGQLVTALGPGATNYTDTNVVLGDTYEYKFVKIATNLTGYGYSWAGIRAPLLEDRGKVILLVDNSFTTNLATELARLQQDLAGDGWTVLRHDVSRTGSVVSVRNLILSDWNHFADVRAVFLLGHIPVPYAGNIAPDDKIDHHKGAWPADVYYAEMTSTWSDFFINNTTAVSSRNWNTPGDGKFDSSFPPSPVELQIGRVDLANMPGKFAADGTNTFISEQELLRQYLNKDHAYRHKLFSLNRRALIHDGVDAREGIAVAATGWRAGAAWFGYTNVDLDVDESWLQRVSTNSYLWSYVSDAGDYNSIGRVGGIGNFGTATTAELVSSNIQTAFVAFLGSWLGDWDSEDNIMRGVLATPSNGLACVYGGTPHWFLHHLGLGENLGYAARLTQNNSPGTYDNQINPSFRLIHIALMGDPTLRLFPPAPPSNFTAAGTSNVMLNWSPSADAGLGYHVYRSTSASGYFNRLTASPIATTNFTDLTAARGTNIYMVRALTLETTGSGTYTNVSQGIFAAVKVTNAPIAPPLITSWLLETNGIVRFEILANTGLNYALLATTNFTDWEIVATLNPTNCPFELVDTNAPAFTARYYRVSASP
ncbi:MAG: fibronectin type III domain-containing protein [Pedosphaera sp.]|nr:fibronectin type III domain-containing protein [Pedosphaera sp.]